MGEREGLIEWMLEADGGGRGDLERAAWAELWVDRVIADAANKIAYRIRAELVCCHIYNVKQEGREPGRMEQQQLDREAADPDVHVIHEICYWGEASARIAETPDQWLLDPTDGGGLR